MTQRLQAVRAGVLAGLLVFAGAVPAAASVPRSSAPGASAPASGEPCAIRDLVSIAVPTPTAELTHDPDDPTIGGKALAGNGLAVTPGSPPLPATVAAGSWLVADLDTGEVLGACGAHRMLAPASVQKVLLAAAVLPKLNPADTVTVTAADLDFGAEWDSKTVPLQVGGAYTVEDLFLGLLMRSGNDAANALARLAGGDKGVPGTIAAMNAEARRLGAWDTHAETPSGLDGPGQVTSAYDLALIFRACFEHEEFRRWIRTVMYEVSPELTIEHDNWEYLGYPGVLGGKAGFTDTARHTFVGAAERDGRRLVVAVLGGEVSVPGTRGWQQTLALFDWGFALPRGASVGQLVAPGDAETLGQEPTATPTPIPSATPAPAPVSAAATPTLPLVAASVGAAMAAGFAVVLLGLARRRRTALATATSGGLPAPSPPVAIAPPATEAPANTPPALQPPPAQTPATPPPDRPIMGQPPPPPQS